MTQEELLSCRKNTITHLIHPLKSVLDDSIGCALWFAARGRGTLDGVAYTSPARVSCYFKFLVQEIEHLNHTLDSLLDNSFGCTLWLKGGRRVYI